MSTSSSYYSSTEETSSDEPVPYIPKVYPENYDLHDFKDTVSRAVPEVVYPASGYLSDLEFRDDKGILQIDNIKNHLIREGRMSLPQIEFLVETASDLFCEEENILMLDAPRTICGDIHGQFYDLVELFNVSGDPSECDYLFLGDYVDRGNFSCEVVFLMYTYKICYPKRFHMIRGNHECRHLTEYFSFKEECLYKYDNIVYDLIMESFDTLPLCAILNKQFFCVHGGLSPNLPKLDDINQIDRFREPPSSGPMCDLLWSDPLEEIDFVPGTKNEFVSNHHRGCSYSYSFDAVCNFLERNNLLCLIRAHEVQDAGYKMMKKNPKTGFPSLITLFSAPNYCESYGNKAAVLKYENNVINIKQFQDVPQPYYLPSFMNVISWSLPFVSEKIASVLSEFYQLVDDEEAEELERAEEEQQKKEAENRLSSIRTKAKTIGAMMSIYKKIRDERENTMKYAQFAVNGVVPENITNMNEEELNEMISTVEGQKSIDGGERRPEIEDEDSHDEKYASTRKRQLSPRLRRSTSIGDLLVQQESSEAPEIVEELSTDDLEQEKPRRSLLTQSVKSASSRFTQSSFT